MISTTPPDKLDKKNMEERMKITQIFIYKNLH